MMALVGDWNWYIDIGDRKELKSFPTLCDRVVWGALAGVVYSAVTSFAFFVLEEGIIPWLHSRWGADARRDDVA
jgi:hypothetical protein